MQAVDHWVYADREEVLVVVSVDVGCDGCPVWIRFAVLERVDLQNAAEADFELDISILVEIIIPNVFCGLG